LSSPPHPKTDSTSDVFLRFKSYKNIFYILIFDVLNTGGPHKIFSTAYGKQLGNFMVLEYVLI
jgi:hypothetical protein